MRNQQLSLCRPTAVFDSLTSQTRFSMSSKILQTKGSGYMRPGISRVSKPFKAIITGHENSSTQMVAIEFSYRNI